MKNHELPSSPNSAYQFSACSFAASLLLQCMHLVLASHVLSCHFLRHPLLCKGMDGSETWPPILTSLLSFQKYWLTSFCIQFIIGSSIQVSILLLERSCYRAKGNSSQILGAGNCPGLSRSYYSDESVYEST